MSNSWEEVSLEDYENHMKLSTVQQLQTLNRIMKSQIYKYKISTVAILGIAGGNEKKVHKFEPFFFFINFYLYYSNINNNL